MPPATRSTVKYPAEYRAPSWSWASLDAEIDYSALGDDVLAACVDVQVEPLGKDAFGRVASGNLTLKGPIYELSFREFDGREGVIHPLQTGVNATWSSSKRSFFGIKSSKVSKKGTAHFDNEPTFPSVALFLDSSYALILKEGEGGTYTRIGRASFTDKAVKADKVDVPKGAVREVTVM